MLLKISEKLCSIFDMKESVFLGRDVSLLPFSCVSWLYISLTEWSHVLLFIVLQSLFVKEDSNDDVK